MFADESKLLQSSLSRLEKQFQLANLAEAKKAEQRLTELLEKIEAEPTVAGAVVEIHRQLLLNSLAELRQHIDTLQEELVLAHTQDSNSLLH